MKNRVPLEVLQAPEVLSPLLFFLGKINLDFSIFMG